MATAFATFSVQPEPFVLRIIINQDRGDNQDFQDIIGAFLKIFESQRQVAVIIDASQLKVLTKQNVKDIRDFLRSNRSTFEMYLKCSTLIVKSVIVKKIINAIFKIQPPIRPNLIVNSMEEADQFVTKF
jgi:hypothetical protein